MQDEIGSKNIFSNTIVVNDRNMQFTLNRSFWVQENIDSIHVLRTHYEFFYKVRKLLPKLIIIKNNEISSDLLQNIRVLKSSRLCGDIPIIICTDAEVPVFIQKYFFKILPYKYGHRDLTYNAEMSIKLFDAEIKDREVTDDILKENDQEVYELAKSFIERQVYIKEKLEKHIYIQGKNISDSLSSFNEMAFINSRYGEEIRNLVKEYIEEDDMDKIREIKVNLKIVFWKLYEEVLWEILSGKELTIYKRLFLRFGLIDTRLLSDSVKDKICSETIENVKQSNIVYADEWFEMIYSGELEISAIDETQKKIPAKEYAEIDGERAFILEFENFKRMCKTAASVNGTDFSFLDSTFIRDPRRGFMMRDTVEYYYKRIDEEVDPLIFERNTEKGYIHCPARVLLLPAYGGSGVAWQSWDKSDRDKPGRIICPLFSTVQPPERTVISAFANYRWTNARDKNPFHYLTEGLIGKYAAMHKNRNRDYSESFVKDYTNWVLKESMGRAVFDKKVRQFFWFNIPFGKYVVEKIQRSPTYGKLYKVTSKKNCLL